MSHITLNFHELDQLKSGSLWLIRPLPNQPPEGYEFEPSVLGCPTPGYVVFAKDGYIPMVVELPYASGQELWVKETWRIANIIMSKDGRVKVLVDYISNSEKLWKQTESRNLEGWMNNGYYRWYVKYSPVTMPKWASRYTVVVKGEVVVKRVQEVTHNEIRQTKIVFFTVYDCDDQVKEFARKWNSHFDKKFPWVNNPYIILFKAEVK